MLASGAEAPKLADLQNWLLEKGLARYKLTERIKIFEEFPRNTIGKIQRFVSLILWSAGVANLVEQAMDQFGQLDVVIGNAGISLNRKTEDTTESELREVMEINFFAAAALTELHSLSSGASISHRASHASHASHASQGR